MSDAQTRAAVLMNLTGGEHSYDAILAMVRKHPQRDDENALAEAIFNGFCAAEWLSDNSEDEDSIDYVVNRKVDINEDDAIVDQLTAILGDMYDRTRILEIVRDHPTKDNIEAVMDTVLEKINIDTVDGDWLRKASSGIENENFEKKKEEPESDEGDELWKDTYYLYEEEVEEFDRNRRNVISDLLATPEHRELAFDVIDLLNECRLKYTLNTILCVLRHHPEPQNIKNVVATFQQGIDIPKWFKKDDKLIEKLPTEDCVICYMDYPGTEMYRVSCDSKHTFCYECLQASIRMSIGEGEIPTCPWGECNHLITELEMLHIYGEGDMLRKFSRTILKAGLASLENLVGCPSPGCENWLVLPETEGRIKCPCESCNKDFCSLCKEIYHYQTTCDELKELKVKWIKWTDNREENIGKVKEIANLKERMQELEQDEAWKRSHLRCCPKCGRPIEKIDGCNSMKCGKDYHGGNKQKGCGARFNWTSAKPYNPPKDHTQHLIEKDISMERNENVLSFGSDGIYGVCDICHEEINGVGFLCLNCPCYTVCEKCESKMEHDEKHIMRVLGIEFIEKEIKEKRSMVSRLRDAVARKRVQLISTFTNEQTEEIAQANPTKKKKSKFIF